MDQSAESTRLPNDRDGPRMVKLQQAFHTALKRAIAKSMTEDEVWTHQHLLSLLLTDCSGQFVSCFSGLSDSQIDLMRQIYPQLFENLEDAATVSECPVAPNVRQITCTLVARLLLIRRLTMTFIYDGIRS